MQVEEEEKKAFEIFSKSAPKKPFLYKEDMGNTATYAVVRHHNTRRISSVSAILRHHLPLKKKIPHLSTCSLSH
ncbi:hypothetical protein ES319_D05G233100v1 [Gossypium barbadense]|uniref:Uncharacterized protein n=2 Tax=Gossypium TaxID=3633 RepID=A0A5J5RH36_GOSBA|nr:hypothetical protein ES319_D05G233100v1 [Gossypium barbadense]TYG69612.1 hypothetical protein ES288_D05G244300v1 [Gossypium darwinii]